MLQEGQKRILQTPYNKNVNFIVGDAHTLDSIESNSVDIYTIAFGIRNCTNVQKVLDTAFRVLKPGGSFHCLEFSKPINETFNSIYDFYSFYAIPRLGQLVADDYDSYQYLVESIRRFPTQSAFTEMIKKAGFYSTREGYENLTMGIAAIHTGYKI